MKCIAYISMVITKRGGADIPDGLPGIFKTARERNAQYNITGVLSYRRGHYIQVIEGSKADVDQLYRNITLDSRHEQVIKILDIEISNRSFPDWDMKLLQSVNKDKYFVKFIEQHADAFTPLDQDKRKLLRHFYLLNDEPSVVSRTYHGKNLMLSAWPDFTVIKQ